MLQKQFCTALYHTLCFSFNSICNLWHIYQNFFSGPAEKTAFGYGMDAGVSIS